MGECGMETRGFSAAERLERLPISGYHRIIFIIIALAFFFDSMDLAMMTFLLGSIILAYSFGYLCEKPMPPSKVTTCKS